MIDPFDSIAFSIHANPRVYALLLGSGLSRAAQIPTGWDLTQDLIHKLAALSGETPDPDPETWYRSRYNEYPDYSKLIDGLAKTQTERQQLLKPYFEATAEDHEEGRKQPTAAHRAIAKLVADGFIRVLITTNFDRLIEKALEEAGVAPNVLSSEDQIQGMVPLIHTPNCLIKLHGDYLDTRIRNTSEELTEYPAAMDTLLDRVFDEFGLIVCGWSADWDVALTSALFRASSRRYTIYWAVHGRASGKAQQLISHRGAQAIDIADADTFFSAVQQKVAAIEELSTPHPLSVDAAVSSLKRCLSEPRYRIEHADLVRDTIDRAILAVSGQGFAASDGNIDTETLTARVRAYESACSPLLPMAVVAGHWAEDDHSLPWQQALSRLATASDESGYPIWLGLQRYPATLLLYALGLGALSSNRLPFLGRLLSTTVIQRNQERRTVAETLPPFCLFENIHPKEAMQLLEGMDRKHVPLNDWLHDTLRPYLNSTVSISSQFDLVFDKLEILLSLSCVYQQAKSDRWSWAPAGSFIYRSENRKQILEEIESSISDHQGESSFVKCGIFGETPEICKASIEQFKDTIGRSAKNMGIFWWN